MYSVFVCKKPSQFSLRIQVTVTTIVLPPSVALIVFLQIEGVQRPLVLVGVIHEGRLMTRFQPYFFYAGIGFVCFHIEIAS